MDPAAPCERAAPPGVWAARLHMTRLTLVTVVGVRQRRTGAVTGPAVLTDAVIIWDRRGLVVAGGAGVAGGATLLLACIIQVATHTVVVLGASPRRRVAPGGCLHVAAAAEVDPMAGRTTLPVHGGGDPVASRPPLVRVVDRLLLHVTLHAGRLLVAHRAVVGVRRHVSRAGRFTVCARPGDLVRRRAPSFVVGGVAGLAGVDVALAGVALQARLLGDREVLGHLLAGLDPAVALWASDLCGGVYLMIKRDVC